MPKTPPIDVPNIFHGRPATNPDRQGFAPPYQSFSDFQFNEAGAGDDQIQSPGEGFAEINVPANLLRRKIYAWIWGNNGTFGDYALVGQINFFLQNSKLGSLPLSVAQSNGLISSKVAIAIPTIASGGAVVQDTLGFWIGGQRNDQPKSVLLQPLYITGKVDKCSIALTRFYHITAARVLIAMVSSS